MNKKQIFCLVAAVVLVISAMIIAYSIDKEDSQSTIVNDSEEKCNVRVLLMEMLGGPFAGKTTIPCNLNGYRCGDGLAYVEYTGECGEYIYGYAPYKEFCEDNDMESLSGSSQKFECIDNNGELRTFFPEVDGENNIWKIGNKTYKTKVMEKSII
jgi:hypothetical protein